MYTLGYMDLKDKKSQAIVKRIGTSSKDTHLEACTKPYLKSSF
jgi:hypothetical protein